MRRITRRWGGNKRRARITRDSILFTVGIAGIVYETLVTKTDRPTLLLLYSAMVGLPAFFRADSVDQEREEEERRRATRRDEDERRRAQREHEREAKPPEPDRGKWDESRD